MPWFQSESGGLRTRRADCTVPGNACRFKTQEGPVLSVQVQSQENKIELESQFKAVRQEEFPLTHGRASPLFYSGLQLFGKTLAPWRKSYDKPRQRIKKQRRYFANKCLYSQNYDFSSSHVRPEQ